jgi:hypothetical protein
MPDETPTPEIIVASVRKRGRKRLPPERARKHAVTCRLTDAERDFVDCARGADEDGKAAVTRGEYIRLAALKAPPRVVPEINREAWEALARTNANLNQAMAAYNASGALKAEPALRELRKDVSALRLLMIGGGTDEEAEDEN